VKGHGVKICKKVPEEVHNVVRAAMDDTPEKKLKTVAGSSNNEVTNTVLASVQEQNNDEVMAQEGDAPFVGEPERLRSFTDEDFEFLRGIFYEV
jgi:disease resistance protein RPS2